MRSFCISSLFWLLFCGLSQAHNINLNELDGVELCLEPRSVQVSILSLEGSEEQNDQTFVKERLWEDLRETLDVYDLPFIEKNSCKRTAGFVYVFYKTHWQKDSNGIPFLNYEASIQVGGMPKDLNNASDIRLPKLKFENEFGVLLFEDELPDYLHEDFLITHREMMTELALSWWESYEIAQLEREYNRSVWLRRGAGLSVFLTSIVIAVGVWIKGRSEDAFE